MQHTLVLVCLIGIARILYTRRHVELTFMDLTVLMSLTIALFLHCWGVTRPDAVCTKKCECQCGNKRKNVTCKTNDIFILKVIGFGFSNRDVQSKLLWILIIKKRAEKYAFIIISSIEYVQTATHWVILSVKFFILFSP